MWQIRAARPEDHDAVISLWEDDGLGRTTENEWQAIVGGACASLFVAEEDGVILGAGVTAFDGWRAYIYHVAVARSHRRRGVARSLMSEGEAKLRKLGARLVFALVNDRMTDGLALCAAAGYELEGDVAFVKTLAN
jgi:ribosomal protein S18 acetylase RimI-like enzyme